MKRNLFFLLTIIIVGCSGNGTKHEDAVKYFVSLAGPLSQSMTSYKEFMTDFSNCHNSSKQNGASRLDSMQLKTVELGLIKFQNSVTDCLMKIDTIGDYDKSLPLKKMSKAHLVFVDSLLKAFKPKCLYIMKNGFENLTDEYLESLKSIVDEESKQSSKTDDAFNNFRDKYSITNKDLKQYGL